MGYDVVGAGFNPTYFASEISDCKRDTTYAEVLHSTNQLADSFKKSDAEGKPIKSPISTFISVSGVVLSTFLIGKNLGKLGASLAKKIPAGSKDKIINGAKNAVEFVNTKLGTIKNAKISDKLTNVFSSAVEYVAKDPSKAIANAAGAAAVAATVPEILKVDGNADGISDIAQHNISAYRNALHGAELLVEIGESLT